MCYTKIIFHHEVNLLFNFLSHKSSASMKAKYLPLAFSIPIFLEIPAPRLLLFQQKFFLTCLLFFKMSNSFEFSSS